MDEMPAREMPKPRYAMGEKVFHASTREGRRSVDCPDCLGQKTWKVESPTGTKADIPCPRCGGSGKISIFAWSPFTTQLTIGQVRMEWPRTTWDSERSVFEYMCVETGVGGGSVYDENRLFTNEGDAKTAAERRAADENSRIKQQPEQVKFDRFNTYTMERALKGEEEDRRRDAERAYEHLLTKILELDTYHVAKRFDEDGDETDELISASLTDEQVETIQNSIVRFDDNARQTLAQHRRDSR